MSEKLKKEAMELFRVGFRLAASFDIECIPEREKTYAKVLEKFGGKLDFDNHYHGWYTKALELVSIFAPRRVKDFEECYKPTRVRKEITYANYTISDALRRLEISRGGETLVSRRAANSQVQAQFKIVESIVDDMDSTLLNIQTVLRAELSDNELDQARLLNKNGFYRAAGAVAGVVLEAHLKTICQNHQIGVKRKSPTLAHYNEALKEAEVIDAANWRFIQYLADVRNMCTHKKSADPTQEQVAELLDGTDKILKTVF